MIKVYKRTSFLFSFLFLVIFSCNKSNPSINDNIQISTSAITSIGTTNAISGGIISAINGMDVSSRGVCWSTTQNPNISNNKTNEGAGPDTFTSNITGLLPNTTYYVRAYAINNAGVFYGNELQFSTNGINLPTVTTNVVSNITSLSAISGGNITNDGGSVITSRGVCWSLNVDPTIANYKTIDGTGAGAFTSNISGLLPNTTYYVKAYGINSAGVVYGNQVTLTTSQSQAGSFTDSRDGQIYTFKQIGSQIWMTQNLNYDTTGSWCYDNLGSNCVLYGRLYEWHTASKVAPKGWHLPSNEEWITLKTYLGGPDSGGKMKATTLWLNPNTAATNISGFTGLPGGFSKSATFDFLSLTYYGLWWSSTQANTDDAWGTKLSWNQSLNELLFYSKTWGFSVRCIKD